MKRLSNYALDNLAGLYFDMLIAERRADRAANRFWGAKDNSGYYLESLDTLERRAKRLQASAEAARERLLAYVETIWDGDLVNRRRHSWKCSAYFESGRSLPPELTEYRAEDWTCDDQEAVEVISDLLAAEGRRFDPTAAALEDLVQQVDGGTDQIKRALEEIAQTIGLG